MSENSINNVNINNSYKKQIEVKPAENKPAQTYSSFNLNGKSKFNDTFEKFVSKASEDKHQRTSKAVLYALSPIPTVRKLSSVPEDIKDGNGVRALGMMAYSAMFLPEDMRDVRDAVNQVVKKAPTSYDNTKYQHEFSFFRGTLAEPLLKFKGKFGQKVSVQLRDMDKTLYDTKFGKLLQKIFKFKKVGEVQMYAYDKNGQKIIKEYLSRQLTASEIGGSKIGKSIGRALLRVPILSLAVISILETPAIIKAAKKGDNNKEKVKEGARQALKSGIKVTSIFASIALLGGKGFQKFKGIGSLVGMALGSFIGGHTAKFINKQIDKKGST